MPCIIEVSFTPAEFEAFRRRDLSKSVCVVFDVLRATSVIVTALANGAKGVVPVEEISEALEIRRKNPDVLLGGERGGLRIGKERTGGIEFDFGNSPREYTSQKVSGKTIVTTTTNGTRALRACTEAQMTIVASFLNLKVVTDFVLQQKPEELWLVCAGTGGGAALEDILAAGVFCERAIPQLPLCDTRDSAEIAWRAYRHSKENLFAAVQSSRNARRLLSNPGLQEDVEFCLRQDCFDLVPVLGKDGVIRKAF